MSWGKVNGGLMQDRELVGVEASVQNKVWKFAENDRGRFDDEVLGGWIRGKDVEAFSKDPFESVKAQILSSGEEKVMDITGGVGGWCWSDGELRIAVSGSGGQESHGRRRPW